MKLCDVIIVNYNTGPLLNKVVNSVYNNNNLNKIVVVDNDSNDDSMKGLKHNNQLETHYRQHNYGFASSCNFGAKLSDVEYMLFLNPDCVLEKGCVDQAIKNFKYNKNIAIIGVSVNNPDGTEQRASRRRLPTLWRSIKSYSKLEKLAKFHKAFAGVNLNYGVKNNESYEVEAISGAFMLIRSDVFNILKGFDEKFPMHFEDLDLFKRVLDNGYKIYYDPGINVTHYQGLSSQSNPQVGTFKKEGLMRYFKKHGTFFSRHVIRYVAKIL